MSQKSRVVLKFKFEAGRTPTEKDFADTLDSGINKIDDQISVQPVGEGEKIAKYIGIGSADPGSPLSIKNNTNAPNLIGFEDNAGNEKWQIEINPEDGDTGLNIGSDKANLLINTDGKVGIGTKTPDEQLEVKGKIKADEFVGTLDWNQLSNIPLTFLVPKGAIIMWSGSIDEIPEGWKLCDGKNNTPNLRDRFIVGAGKSYDVESTGGFDSVQLTTNQMPAHNHPIKDSGHNHGVSYDGALIAQNTAKKASVGFENGGSYGPITGYGSISIGNKETGISIKNQGGGKSHENLPPYYALCFIMKT